MPSSRKPRPARAARPAGPEPVPPAASERRNGAAVRDVVADVRERISVQSILPGARITEEELSDSYGIPRAVAREVLAALEERGLVHRIRNKGAVVTVLDVGAILRYYELREALDGLAVRLATQKTSRSDWTGMAKLLGAPFDQCLKDRDIDRLIGTIEVFRKRLIEAAASPELADLDARVYERLRVARRRVALLPGRLEKSVVQYRALLAAIMEGDADKAEARAKELNRSNQADIQRYASFVQ